MKNEEKRNIGNIILKFIYKTFPKLTDIEIQRIFSNLYSRFRNDKR